MSAPAPRVVLTGVSGSGKTTIGELLAPVLHVPFVDADDFHPPANRARMARGEPLDDVDRVPWLAALAQHLAAHAGGGFVLACSALRQQHRDRLTLDLGAVTWVHLHVAPDELQRRLEQRRDHFFPASLLASQIAAWEPLRDGLVVDAGEPPPVVVAAIVDGLARAGFMPS